MEATTYNIPLPSVLIGGHWFNRDWYHNNAFKKYYDIIQQQHCHTEFWLARYFTLVAIFRSTSLQPSSHHCRVSHPSPPTQLVVSIPAGTVMPTWDMKVEGKRVGDLRLPSTERRVQRRDIRCRSNQSIISLRQYICHQHDKCGLYQWWPRGAHNRCGSLVSGDLEAHSIAS
jgi:hypothetical protein